jgi:NitT/TauT family transport system substrate-binding protein
MVTIRVTDPRAVGGALFHIALEKGYFAEQGIAVEVVGVQTGDEAIRALLSNSADVALGGLIPYSFLALDDQSVKIFAVNAYVGDNQVIANTSRGIATAEDLRGKKVGYTKTTASDIGIIQFLSAHGMTVHDVELVNMKPLAMAAALQSGQIDAYSSWEPHVFNGQRLLGNDALVFGGGSDVYTWHQALMATDPYLVSHRDALVKFVRALKQAETFIATHKEEAIVLAAKHNNVSPDVLTTIWPRYDFSISLRDDISTTLATDLAWANTQREHPAATIPTPDTLISRSILNDEIR